MKKIIKYILIGCSAFLILKNITKAKNQFELEIDPNNWTYIIEKGPHKFQLYFHLVRDNETNELVYCLEPGVALSNEIYEELNEMEYEKLNLTEEEKNFITKIAYYGYNEQNHNHLNYYYAAQLLIWEKIIPEDWNIYFTDHLGGTPINPFTKEQQEILSLITEDEKLPSIANQTFEWLKTNSLNLIDTTNSLEGYQLVSQNKVEVKKEGNELQIKNPQGKEITLEFQKDYIGSPLKFYYRSDGQNVLKRGSLTPKKFQIYLHPYETEVEIHKINEYQNNIEGVEFQLYNKETHKLIKNLITNEQGLIKLSNIELGDYCLKEISTPKEYILNPKEICFNLSKEQKKITLEIENKQKKVNLILAKEDAETKEKLGGVRFQLWQKENCIFDGYTNEAGILEISNLTVGSYLLKEIETIDDYILEKEPKVIEITGEDQEIKITISNRKLTKVPNTLEQSNNISNNFIFYEERKQRK